LPAAKLIIYKTEDFKKSFGLSLALHGIILLIFILKFIFFSESTLIDLSQAINVSVGDFTESQKLPPKMNEPTLVPTAELTAPSQAEPINKTIEDKKTKSEKIKAPDSSLLKEKQKAALTKLKKATALEKALEKIKQDLKNDSIKKIKEHIKNAAPANNSTRIITAGTVLGGLDKLQANNYLQEVDQSIKKFWALPQWLKNTAFKSQLLVKFNMQGQILSLKIISSSGNSSYDQYCIRAVEKAAPFPAVPEKLTEKFSVDGVIIGFPE